MKSHRLWDQCGNYYHTDRTGSCWYGESADAMSVVQRTQTVSSFCSRNLRSFSVQGTLPFSIHVDDSIGIKKWRMVSELRLPIHPLG